MNLNDLDAGGVGWTYFNESNHVSKFIRFSWMERPTKRETNFVRLLHKNDEWYDNQYCNCLHLPI